MKNTIQMVVIIAITITMMTNCNNKNPKKEVCEYNKFKVTFIEKNTSIIVNGNIWCDQIDDIFPIFAMNSHYDSNLETFLSSINFPVFQHQDSVFATVIYLNKSILENASFDKNNIIGVSRYRVIGSNLFHELFKKINSIYNLQEEATIKVPGVTSNHLNYYSKSYFHTKGEKNSYIVIYGNQSLPYKNKPVNGNIPIIYKYTQIPGDGGGNGSECVKPCTFGDNTYCLLSPYGYECYPDGGPNDPCTNEAIINIIKGNQKDVLIDAALLYKFRSSFLIQNETGRKYIGYYDAISKEIHGKMNMDIALQTVDAFHKTKEIIVDLLNPEVNSGKILIDSDKKKILVNLIYSYKKISKNHEVKLILDDILSDIDLYSGKSVEDVAKQL